MIRATGIRYGETISVEIIGGKYTFNEEYNPEKEKELKDLILSGMPVMGTYIPDDKLSNKAYICGVLSERYFDDWTRVEVIDENIEAIDDEESGVIY